MRTNLSTFDELDWLPELEDEWETESRFTFTGVPPSVLRLLTKVHDPNRSAKQKAGMENLAVIEGIRLGERDENTLTDWLFFNRYRSRNGRYISRTEADYDGWSKKWLWLRDNVVRPRLSGVRIPAPEEACPAGPCVGQYTNEDVRDLRMHIVSNAIQEWERWGRGTVTECDAAIQPVLFQYWQQGAGINPNTVWPGTQWCSAQAWSAAFISWVINQATDGTPFDGMFGHYTFHSNYVRSAQQNARDAAHCNAFKAFPSASGIQGSVAPHPGDVVVRTRAGGRSTWANVLPNDPGHGDIVTASQPHFGRLTVIGGNVSPPGAADPNLGTTVGKKYVTIDEAGFLTQAAYYAVVRAC